MAVYHGHWRLQALKYIIKFVASHGPRQSLKPVAARRELCQNTIRQGKELARRAAIGLRSSCIRAAGGRQSHLQPNDDKLGKRWLLLSEPGGKLRSRLAGEVAKSCLTEATRPRSVQVDVDSYA